MHVSSNFENEFSYKISEQEEMLKEKLDSLIVEPSD